MTLSRSSLLALIVLVSACSGGLKGTGQLDGRTRTLEQGLPDFDLEVLARPSSPLDSVLVHVGLIPAALVFSPERISGSHTAQVRIEVRSGKRLLLEARDSLSFAEKEPTRSFHRFVRTFRIPRPEGEGRLEVQVEDLSSGRVATRRQSLWRLSSPQMELFPVSMADADGPVVSLGVPGTGNALRFSATGIAKDPGCVMSLLLSVPTDTLPATLPYALAPSYGSVTYRGALYDQLDTLSVWSEPVEAGLVNLSWPVPSHLPLGVYWAGVSRRDTCDGPISSPEQGQHTEGMGGKRSAGSTQAVAWRPFVVRPADFPRITRLEQLIDGLTYLATEDELAQIRAAGGPDEQRQAFDAFWGRTIGDPNRASEAIARYYGRMEEANRSFSAFKEGWKTDRGMVYMIMGPPLYSEYSVEELRWFYSYDDRDVGRYFIFSQVRGHPDEMDLPHFVLKRSAEQEREWRLAVQRWRRGAAR